MKIYGKRTVFDNFASMKTGAYDQDVSLFVLKYCVTVSFEESNMFSKIIKMQGLYLSCQNGFLRNDDALGHET